MIIAMTLADMRTGNLFGINFSKFSMVFLFNILMIAIFGVYIIIMYTFKLASWELPELPLKCSLKQKYRVKNEISTGMNNRTQ